MARSKTRSANGLRKESAEHREFRLSKTVLNHLFRHAVEAGFEPGEFEFSEFVQRGGDMLVPSFSFMCSTMIHSSSGAYFKFGVVLDVDGFPYFPGEWSPGVVERREGRNHNDRESQVETAVRTWLPTLRKDLKTPNLWETYREAAQLAVADGSANEPLNPTARGAFIHQLNAIQLEFEERYKHSDETLVSLRREVRLLKEASNRLGWIDLRRSAVASMVTLGIEHGALLAQEWLRWLVPIFVGIPQIPDSVIG